MITGTDVTCDESNLSGEAEHVEKQALTADNYNDVKNTLFSKSICCSGFGYGLVIAVGFNTEAGKIAKTTGDAEKENTILMRKLERIADFISKIGISAGVLCFIGTMVRIFLEMNDTIPCGCSNLLACE